MPRPRAIHGFLLLCLLAMTSTRAEIQEFYLVLPATSTSIRFTELYLRGPGSVDVSGLTLTAVSQVHKSSYYNPPAKEEDDAYDDDDGYEEGETEQQNGKTVSTRGSCRRGILSEGQ